MRYRRVLKPNASTGITTFKYTRILFICEILQPKTWLKLPVPGEILSHCHPIQLPQHTHIHTDTQWWKRLSRGSRDKWQAKDGEKIILVTEQFDAQNKEPPITFRDWSTEDFNSISYSIDLGDYLLTRLLILVIYLFYWVKAMNWQNMANLWNDVIWQYNTITIYCGLKKYYTMALYSLWFWLVDRCSIISLNFNNSNFHRQFFLSYLLDLAM